MYELDEKATQDAYEYVMQASAGELIAAAVGAYSAFQYLKTNHPEVHAELEHPLLDSADFVIRKLGLE